MDTNSVCLPLFIVIFLQQCIMSPEFLSLISIRESEQEDENHQMAIISYELKTNL
jgi:hypothetical protein